MDKHLIFMDIDGTLVDRDQTISPKTRSVITDLQKDGHLFYVATGRKYSSAFQMAQSLNKDTQIVASNGSIYSIHETIHKTQLTMEAIIAVYETVLPKNLPIFFFGEHTVFYTDTMPDHLKKGNQVRISTNGEEDFCYVDSLHTLKAVGHRIVNGLVVAEGREEELPSLQKQLAETNLLSVSSSHPNNIELIPKGINKATAIQEIQKSLDVPKSRVISFGDGMNDLEMLQASGVSVAMGNAVPQLKEHAKHLTDANTEDGIANFLLRYFG